jgi:gamma-glutamylcyclotransferase (GGCT)/AIG2-like uncharacterized protein YtfP
MPFPRDHRSMRLTSSPAVERLFVYGSLKPGHANAHVLEAIGGTWQAASVKGTLHPEGWGAGIGYPALTLDEDGTEVRGFVFTSDRLAPNWERLDEFEGDDYERVVTAVRLEDMSTVEAHVYVLHRSKVAG